MTKPELQEQIKRLEGDAIEEYLYLSNTNLYTKDYLNPEIMGILNYSVYVDLYFEMHGKCFECECSPCDEGCLYQVDKGDKNE